MNYWRWTTRILFGGFLFLGALSTHAATPTVVSGKITGQNTVTLLFSEPVNTNMTSYYNFTGALAGHNLVGLSGGGSNTITLSFDGSALSGSSGGLTIGPGTTALSDAAPFTGGAVSVLGGQVPTVMSFSIFSSNAATALGRAGDTLTVSFTMSQPINTPTVFVAGHQVYPSGSGMGPYSAIYTVVPADVNGTPLSASINFSDASGNSGATTISFSGTGAASASAPIITSVTSDARGGGWLRAGNTITFTANLLTAVPNGRVSGSYNGVPLVWTAQNNGLSYTAVYTIAAGQSSQTTPVQIGGVTITDLSSGATSAPAAGYDVTKTISANAPYLVETIPVPASTGSQNPLYTFNSNASGTISYGGDCVSPTTAAFLGSNTITFSGVAFGPHAQCTITVTDYAGNVSAALRVSPFTVLGGPATASSSSTTSSVASTSGTDAQQALLSALQARLAALQAGGSTTPATPAPSRFKFTTFLKLGSRGEAVLELQKRLKEDGYLTAAPNGVFGPSTEAAVKKLQRAHGLKVVGELGPATRAFLNK